MQINPSWNHIGVPAESSFLHFHTSTILGSACYI